MEESDQASAHALNSNSAGEPPSVRCKGDKPEAVNIGCGWGRFRPAFMAPFAHVWTFVVVFIVYSFTHGVNGSYSSAILTTIERRFNLSSTLVGVVLALSIPGYLVSVLFVSYFFAKKNKPLLYAICMLVTTLGAFLYFLPHIVYGTGNYEIDAADAQRETLFNSTAPPNRGSGAVQLCVNSSAFGGPAKAESRCNGTQRQTADEDVSPVAPAVAMFAMAEIMQGVSGAPLWTLGLVFIDDHTAPELSAKIIGLMYAVRLLAPVTAFAMGGYFLTIYANLKETHLTPKQPQWIGAWWLGFLVTTIINFVICIPTSMLPEKLRPIKKSFSCFRTSTCKGKKSAGEKEVGKADGEVKKAKQETEKEQKEEADKKEEIEEKEKKDEKEDDTTEKEVEKRAVERDEEDKNQEEEKEEKKMEHMEMSVSPSTTEQGSSNGPKKSSDVSSVDWKEFPKALKRLITNPIYMLALVGMCIDWSALAFMSFMPKYFEVHFQKTASVASLLGGMVPSIFAAGASYVGGMVSGKIKGIDGGVAGLCRMSSILSFIVLLLLVPAMLLSCPNVPHAGQVVDKRLNLTSDCNVNCGCLADAFDPVCGSDGFLYFSPCHAGCRRLANSTADQYDLTGRQARSAECVCVAEKQGGNEDGSGGGNKDGSGGGNEDGRGGVVFAGFCDNSCVSLIPYIVIVVAMYIGNNLYNAADTTIFLRCIREEDKSVSLGLQVFFICVALFPGAAIYGAVFDSSCILKKTTSCSNSEGNCLLYDRHALRLGYHGLAIIMKSLATIFYTSAFFVARRKRSQLTAQQKYAPTVHEAT